MQNGSARKVKFSEIDVAKGLGIILVVMGHSFPDASLEGGIQNPVCNVIFDMIYSFHMPLFFFLSGFVAKLALDGRTDKLEIVKKRFFRLMIPYFVWGGVYVPFRIVLAQFSSATFEIEEVWKILIGKNPYSGLWFLYALFFVSCISIMLIDNLSKLNASLGVSLALLLFCKYYTVNEPLRWLFAYTFYYLIGIYARNRWGKVHDCFKNKKVAITLSAAFVVLFILKRFNETFILSGLLSVIIAMIGIMLILSVSIILKNRIALKRIGQYCMDVYVLSGPILVMMRILLYTMIGVPYIPYCLIATVSGIVIPAILSKLVIKKSRVLSVALVGDVSKK